MGKRELPYTGLTYKHHLIIDNLDFHPDQNIAEVGVGTGYSCFKLAAKTATVLGVDVAADLIAALEEYGKPYENVKFLEADVTKDAPPECYRSFMDVAFSIDTLNYIAPPNKLFYFIKELLKPGGKALVAFPNEPDEVMEGVSNFKDKGSLAKAIEDGGLICDSLIVSEYTRWFNFVSRNLWYRAKRLVYRSHYNGKTNPQVFSDTVAFKMLKKQRSVNWLVRAYTSFIMILLRAGGVYQHMNTNEIYGKYIMIKLRKPAHPES